MGRKDLRGEVCLVWASGVLGFCAGSQMGVEETHSPQRVIPGFGWGLAL